MGLTLAPGTYMTIDLPGGGQVKLPGPTTLVEGELFHVATAGGGYDFTVTAAVRPWPFGTIVRTTVEAGGVPSKAVIVVDPGGNERLTKPRGLVVSDDRIDDVEILDPAYWEPDA